MPYERPPLSKDFLAGESQESDTLINPPSFYEEAGITLQLATVVARVDAPERRLHTTDGEELTFENLLVATGARVRTLDVAGATLPGVFYLRSLDDARRLRAAYSEAKRAVVVGAGFIGMEVASVLARQGLETTLVFPGDRVWSAFFTPEMSAFFERYYEERGVSIARGEMVAFIGGDGRVRDVVTRSGRALPADIVVAGVGVEPAVDPLRDSGIECDDGVLVNEYLETSAPGVWAAGDVARYHDVIFDKRRRIEHWDNAVEQGKHAARLMLGERERFEHVPYFFSDVFDLSYEFWGDTEGASEVIYRGDVASGSFSAWWLRDGVLTAAFVMSRPDDERDAAPDWIAGHRRVDAETLRSAGSLE